MTFWEYQGFNIELYDDINYFPYFFNVGKQQSKYQIGSIKNLKKIEKKSYNIDAHIL